MGDDLARIHQLEQELAELKRRMPAHSVPPSMVMRLEEIEGELAELRRSTEAS
ncbi:MAG: hypothetical protein M0Z94_08045 [Dehalococcoidales bacterium]|nr:hypothetical protein [Dehalococcoidales bacterium]